LWETTAHEDWGTNLKNCGGTMGRCQVCGERKGRTGDEQLIKAETR